MMTNADPAKPAKPAKPAYGKAETPVKRHPPIDITRFWQSAQRVQDYNRACQIQALDELTESGGRLEPAHTHWYGKIHTPRRTCRVLPYQKRNTKVTQVDSIVSRFGQLTIDGGSIPENPAPVERTDGQPSYGKHYGRPKNVRMDPYIGYRSRGSPVACRNAATPLAIEAPAALG